MQIFVRNLVGKTLTLQVNEADRVCDLKAQIESREGIPVSMQRLVCGGKQLEGSLLECGVQDDFIVDVRLGLDGGVIEPTLQALARKYNVEKLICRKCYARLPPRASNCRKKKCGHSNELRPKKKLK
eukprot:c5113_g2_i1.p1 GENE.c5113_g2_i1~~c5113_g2_i1.p1  ORF type:complete len:127 (-),score=22.57 c5113_g2_i1:56-436(-)